MRDLFASRGGITGSFTAERPAILRITPEEAVAGIGTNIKISVTFTTPMRPETMTANSANTQCSGSLQVSSDNFISCIQMTGNPAASQADTVFTLTPAALAPFTTYKIRVTQTARSAGNEALPQLFSSTLGFVTASGPDNIAPQLLVSPSFIQPANAATNIALNTGISMLFLEAISPATISTNTTDSSCSGSIQLSADNFVTCVKMAAAPTPTYAQRLFVLYPAANLTAGTLYSVRVKGSVTDLAGNAFVEQTTTFTTGSTITATAPAVNAVAPIDGATNQAVSPYMQISFSTAMDNTSFSFNTTDNECKGSIQVSGDNFVTCVRLSNAYFLVNGFGSVTLMPDSPLANATTYKIRTTSEIRDLRGIAATPFTSATGFSTQAAGGGGAAVYKTIPGELSTFNNVQTPFTVIFNKAMLPGTITVNITDNTCAGYSFQISTVANVWTGTTCLRFAAQPVVGNGNIRFTVYPTTTLTPNEFYGVRITTAALDYTSSAVTAYDSITGIRMAP